jgi:hypothetical protein
MPLTYNEALHHAALRLGFPCWQDVPECLINHLCELARVLRKQSYQIQEMELLKQVQL